jgi:UDP-2,4-diacetamido-2,4,6-trideoxy-beta-L-altropyranose hydrolase
MILDVNNYNTFKDLNEYCHYLKGLKKLFLFLVSFEDFKVYPPISDMVIIPYVGAEKLNLHEEKNCIYMLGPKYFVLREEFLKVKHVIIRNKIKNILVTMGGSDSEGITLEVLRVLCDTELDISLKVIIGGLSQIDDAEIKNALNTYKGSYSIIRDVNNMAQIMSESDIAIINSGLTKYETSAVGLPSIVISNNKYHLGPESEVKKDQISEAVAYLVNDYEKRQKMSNAGKSLIDGNGVARIFSEIPRELIYA